MRSLFAHLTTRCPLHCRYCYIDAGSASPELDAAGWGMVFAGAEPLRPARVVLTGGEPLLHSELLRIAELARAIISDVSVCLNTSGFAIEGYEHARALAEAFDDIRVSLDGPLDIHDTMRGAGRFADAVSALRLLRSAGAKVSASVTLSRIHDGREDETLSFLRNGLGLSALHFNYMKPVGRAALEDLAPPTGRTRRYFSPHSPLPQGEICAGSTFSILPNGDVYPCHLLSEAEFFIGNATKTPLHELVRVSPVLKRLSDMCEGIGQSESGKCPRLIS